MKTARMAQMLMVEYICSGRILVEAILIAVAVLFLRLAGLSPAVVSLGIGMAALLVTIVVTYRVTSWANRSTAYMVMVRPLGRAGYLLAAVLVSWLLAEVLHLTLRLAAWPILGLHPTHMLATVAPMALALTLVVAVTAFLSPLVAGGEWLRTVFVVLFALSVYRDDLGQWNDIVQRGLQAFWMTFAVPVLGALNLSAGWGYPLPLQWLSGVTIVETVLILGAAVVFFSQRELDWD